MLSSLASHSTKAEYIMKIVKSNYSRYTMAAFTISALGIITLVTIAMLLDSKGIAGYYYVAAFASVLWNGFVFGMAKVLKG